MAAGSSKRHIRQGDQLSACRAPACAAQAKSESSSRDRQRADSAEPAAIVTPVRAISCVRAKQQPVLPKPRTKAAAEMVSELRPLAVASVMPGRVISCLRRAAACAAHAMPKAKAAAEIVTEMESGLKPPPTASAMPVRAISCVRARSSSLCCPSRGQTSSRDGKRAEAAASGEHQHICQGDQLGMCAEHPPECRPSRERRQQPR